MSFNPFSTIASKVLSALLVAALLASALVTIDRNQWRASAKRADAALALVKPAQDLALAKARQAITDTEARYKDHAHDADTHHADTAATARTDADAYSATHRVPACPSGATRGPVASTPDRDTGVPADLSAFTLVADSDVRACSGAAAYALASHDWAIGLEAQTSK
jgi:hypothetical protein